MSARSYALIQRKPPTLPYLERSRATCNIKIKIKIMWRRGLSSSAGRLSWKLRLPQRLRGGLLEKWGDYWTTVAQDYKEVALDTVKESRKHPLKTSAYMSLIAGVVYAVKTNPDERDYKDALHRYMNESAMLSSRVRNAKVDDHLHYMADCIDHHLLRRLSLGICSFLWVDNYSKECGVFKSQCGYLKPRYLTFHQRVQDVGFLGRWWRTQRLMEEFDINHQELPQEPDESALRDKLELMWEFTKGKVSQIRNVV